MYEQRSNNNHHNSCQCKCLSLSIIKTYPMKKIGESIRQNLSNFDSSMPVHSVNNHGIRVNNSDRVTVKSFSEKNFELICLDCMTQIKIYISGKNCLIQLQPSLGCIDNLDQKTKLIILSRYFPVQLRSHVLVTRRACCQDHLIKSGSTFFTKNPQEEMNLVKHIASTPFGNQISDGVLY